MSRGSSQAMYDRHITIFSPEGNLYQIEYSIKAVKNSSINCISIRGAAAACIVVQHKSSSQQQQVQQQQQQDKLLDTNYLTSIYTLSPFIGAALIGMQGDCRSISYRAQQEAANFYYKYGYNISCKSLAHRIANLNQVYTQFAYMRLHACTGIMISYDEEEGPQVYKFDPAGFVAGYTACAAGAREQEATNLLEKLIKKKKTDTEQQVVRLAISALQQVLSVDLKGNDIEVGVVSEENRHFRLLTTQEIDAHLTAIAEED